MKTTVVYHSADYDGLFCREIARKFLPDAELIGWNYGDPYVELPRHNGPVYVLDLSPEVFGKVSFSHATLNQLIWIDHHKTAIEKFPQEIPGYRIDGVAACRLAWQWFTTVDGNTLRTGAEIGIPIRPAGVLPAILDYRDRTVDEPLAVRLAGEYDIWDRRDPNAEIFQYGLDAQAPPTPLSWETLLSNGAPRDQMTSGTYVGTILRDGEAARNAIQKREADTITARAHTLEFRGLSFLALNTARCNSLSFKAGIRPEHDALMGYYWNGKQWTFSLYGVPNKPDFDLSAIAKTFPGGGGHRAACGFQVGWEEGKAIVTLPF